MKVYRQVVVLLVVGISSALYAESDGYDNVVIESVPDNGLNSVEYSDEYNLSPLSSDGGDLLGQFNGVSVSRFGGKGLEPIIRGQSQTRLNVLLDGAYVQGGCPNRMDPPASWAALETYENVAVLKGVQTLQYGGGGGAGTVLFERYTKDLALEKGVQGRVGGLFTNNGTKLDVFADIVVSGDEFYMRTQGEIKSVSDYEDGNGDVVRSSFKHNQGLFVLGYKPSDRRFFELSYEHNSFLDALYPGAGMDSPKETGEIFRLRYAEQPQSPNFEKIQLDVYLSDIDHLMDNYSLRANMGKKMAAPTHSKTSGGRLVVNSNFGGRDWTYGVDLQKNTRNAVLNNMNDELNAFTVGIMWPDTTIEQLGFFAEVENEYSSASRLKYGLRLDHVNSRSDKANVKKGMGEGHSANESYQYYYGNTAKERSEDNIGGLVRYEHDFKQVLFFSGASRSVRVADATERGINKWTLPSDANQRWVGNPDIASEKHTQFDMGLSAKGERSSVGVVAFFDDVEDYILRDTARGQKGILRSDNADIYRNINAEIYGVELESTFSLKGNLEMSGSLAYVRAVNVTDDRPIAQTPPLNGKVQLNYMQDKGRIGARLNFSSSQGDIDVFSKQEVGETAGFVTFDVYADHEVNDNLVLRMGVDNLFDKAYALHASRSNLLDANAIKVNEAGLTAWIKLTANF